jgi:hypothetical protein
LNYCQAQKVDLSLKLKKGSVYSQVSTSKATIIQTVNGQQMNMQVNITGTMNYLVTDIKENVYNMEVKYKNLAMEMNLPQGNVKFSSDKPDEKDVFSTLFAGMIDKPFFVKMTKKGRIEQIKGIDSLFERLMAKFPQLSNEQKAGIRSQLMNSFGEKAFKGNMELMTAVFPDNPVSKGDVWKVNTNLASSVKAKVQSIYGFKGESNSNYTIHGDSKIATDEKAPYVETNGMPMKYNLTGSMTSDIKIDKESGWIVEARVNQEMKGNTQIKDSPKTPGGMTIPMTMKNETLVTNK